MAPDQRHFVARGVGENWTRDRNRAKLDEMALNPPVLVDTTERDLSTTCPGAAYRLPDHVRACGWADRQPLGRRTGSGKGGWRRGHPYGPANRFGLHLR